RAARRAAREGSPARIAGGTAPEDALARAAGGTASAGTGSTRRSPSMWEPSSGTVALAIDNALPSAIPENSLMTPIAAATRSVAGFLCRETAMPAGDLIQDH